MALKLTHYSGKAEATSCWHMPCQILQEWDTKWGFVSFSKRQLDQTAHLMYSLAPKVMRMHHRCMRMRSTR